MKMLVEEALKIEPLTRDELIGLKSEVDHILRRASFETDEIMKRLEEKIDHNLSLPAQKRFIC